MTPKKNLSIWLLLSIACCLILCSCATKQTTFDIEIRYIYLAGPFFNDEEIATIEYVESVLKQKGLEY